VKALRPSGPVRLGVRVGALLTLLTAPLLAAGAAQAQDAATDPASATACTPYLPAWEQVNFTAPQGRNGRRAVDLAASLLGRRANRADVVGIVDLDGDGPDDMIVAARPAGGAVALFNAVSNAPQGLVIGDAARPAVEPIALGPACGGRIRTIHTTGIAYSFDGKVLRQTAGLQRVASGDKVILYPVRWPETATALRTTLGLGASVPLEIGIVETAPSDPRRLVVRVPAPGGCARGACEAHLLEASGGQWALPAAGRFSRRLAGDILGGFALREEDASTVRLPAALAADGTGLWPLRMIDALDANPDVIARNEALYDEILKGSGCEMADDPFEERPSRRGAVVFVRNPTGCPIARSWMRRAELPGETLVTVEDLRSFFDGKAGGAPPATPPNVGDLLGTYIFARRPDGTWRRIGMVPNGLRVDFDGAVIGRSGDLPQGGAIVVVQSADGRQTRLTCDGRLCGPPVAAAPAPRRPRGR
jgi:hypothetical protein